jgi:hypothetical protein
MLQDYAQEVVQSGALDGFLFGWESPNEVEVLMV